MGPPKGHSQGKKKKHAGITIHIKKEIIAKRENGIRVKDLAAEFGMARSTICTILKNKEVIKKADVAKGVTVITKQRPQTIEDMEKLLLIWIDENKFAGNNVTEGMIREEAKRLHDDLVKNSGGEAEAADAFKASRGWLMHFKKRNGMNIGAKHEDSCEKDKSPTGFAEGFCEAIVDEMPTEEEAREEVPTYLIREVCAKWDEVKSFVERYNPAKEVTRRCINIFDGNVMCYIRSILQCRPKQMTLDKFLENKKSSLCDAKTSGIKRQRKVKVSSPKE